MSKKKNTSTLAGQKLRIRILHQIILNEPNRIIPTKGGDRAYLVNEINKKLVSRGLNTIGVKTLELDIKAIKSGDFEEADHSLPLLEKGHLYDLRFDHDSKRYKYYGHRIPNIPFLTEEEDHTIAFLMQILEEHKDLPVIKKLISESSTLFNKSFSDAKSRKSFVFKKPVYSNEKRGEKMIERAVELLGYIEKQQAIRFDYVECKNLKQFEGTGAKRMTFKAYPLCVRMHENLYYLTTICQKNPDKKRGNKFIIRNLRIDHIVDKSIKLIPNPKAPHLYETFVASDEWAKHEVEKQFNKAIGIWNLPKTAIEEIVHIRFYGWAANQLKVFDIHPSQVIIETNSEMDYVDLQFKFYTYSGHQIQGNPHRSFYKEGVANGTWSPQDFPFSDLFHRYPEAAHILGKYINFMHVLK